MLIKTKAIVLHCIPHNDSTSIVHLYTEDYGRVSYLASISNKRKTGLKRAFFQPLSLTEIEADHKGSRQLQRIKEIGCLYPFSEIPVNQAKSTICLFLAEVLYRSLRETEKNPALFEFISKSVQLLDLYKNGLANFHIVFLIKLTRYLGFYPNLESQHDDWYFDLQSGVFVPKCPYHNAWLNPSNAQRFAMLMRINYENMGHFRFSHNERTEILSQILKYYRLHLAEFPEIKSLEILQEVFADHNAEVPGTR